jgi:hypothetical protein
MERWVDESKIHIVGYQPRLLGKTDDEALRGFLERMDGLVAFSKVRALKLRPLVEKVEKRVNQPLELECALEVARVSADLLHTLFTLGLRPPDRPGAGLRGTLTFPPPAGYAALPAKVVLVGTPYSTTADEKGRFHFRDLPAGTYRAWALAPGAETEKLDEVVLRAGTETVLDHRLRPDRVPGNLVRNAAFALSWLAPERPDGWQRDPVRRGRWASALVRVPVEKTCVVRVELQDGQRVPLAVRWRSDPSSAQAGRESPLDLDRRDEKGRVLAERTPDRLQKPFEKGILFLEVLIETDRPLAEVCRHVAVAFSK